MITVFKIKSLTQLNFIAQYKSVLQHFRLLIHRLDKIRDLLFFLKKCQKDITEKKFKIVVIRFESYGSCYQGIEPFEDLAIVFALKRYTFFFSEFISK